MPVGDFIEKMDISSIVISCNNLNMIPLIVGLKRSIAFSSENVVKNLI